MPHLARKGSAEVLASGPKNWVYRLPNAAPRVTLNPRVLLADAEALIEDGQFPAEIGPAEIGRAHV